MEADGSCAHACRIAANLHLRPHDERRLPFCLREKVFLAINGHLICSFRNFRPTHPLVPTLILLCACDSLQLLVSILVLFVPALHEHFRMDENGAVAQFAYIATGSLAGLLLTSHCAVIWTMCYITVQRHRAIVFPLRTVADHSRHSSAWPLVAIFGAAICFNLTRWLENAWQFDQVLPSFNESGIADDTFFDPSTETRWMLIHEKREWALSKSYKLIVSNALIQRRSRPLQMDRILYPLAVYLGPACIITLLTMRILSHINASRAAVTTGGYRRRMEREKRSVWLLISVVVAFFFFQTGKLLLLSELRLR